MITAPSSSRMSASGSAASQRERSSAARGALTVSSIVVTHHRSALRNSTSGRGPTWLITSAAAIEPSAPHRSRSNPCVQPYRNPAANRSPAPVVSITLSTGTAGTRSTLVGRHDHTALGADGDRRELAFVAQRRRPRRRTSRAGRARAVRRRCRTAGRPRRWTSARKSSRWRSTQNESRQRQRHHATVGVRHLGRTTERRLGIVAVVQVALHVQHRCRSAIACSSRSSTHSRLDTPRYVFIVRSASGVTTMMQRPVGVLVLAERPGGMPRRRRAGRGRTRRRGRRR